MSLCNISVVGNLGGEPDLRDVNGSSVCSFSMAHNRKVKGEEETLWFNVSAWGKLGELCHQYLSKGRQVAVAGQFRAREYEHEGATRTSLDIRATDVHFIGSRDDAPRTSGGGQDDDIPF